MPAEVIRKKGFSCQACVPDVWSDAQILKFVNEDHPCGTENGWVIRRDGDPALEGDPERQPCATRAGHVHVVLDA